MKATVVGTGYVGLVTGVCLAAIGHEVICIDNNPEKVQLLKQGRSPIYEPGLEELLAQTIESGRIRFSEDLAEGVDHGQVIFIAVGTPALPNGESNMSYVEAVARGIGRNLSDSYKIIVNKSTVPVGSGDWVRMLILDGVLERASSLVPAGAPGNQSLPRHHFDVVSNPEFLREGTAVYDTFNPDRIVLGSDSATALETMQELYEPIVMRRYAERQDLPPVPVLLTDLASAEMIKYAANAFLATKISFINEVANICDRVGADVTRVAQGIGLDSRIGRQFLNAGIGWGGSCFPKDVSALTHIAADYGFQTKILQAVIEVNQSQRLVALEKLQQLLKILKGKTIGLLGLTFKPDTDDLRDAPSLTLIEQLNRLGAKVKAYDPLLSPHNKQLEGAVVTQSVEELAEGCDALVVVTEWREFRTLNFEALASRMRQPILLDGRNFLDRSAAEQAGFRYYGIGR